MGRRKEDMEPRVEDKKIELIVSEPNYYLLSRQEYPQEVPAPIIEAVELFVTNRVIDPNEMTILPPGSDITRKSRFRFRFDRDHVHTVIGAGEEVTSEKGIELRVIDPNKISDVWVTKIAMKNGVLVREKVLEGQELSGGLNYEIGKESLIPRYRKMRQMTEDSHPYAVPTLVQSGKLLVGDWEGMWVHTRERKGYSLPVLIGEYKRLLDGYGRVSSEAEEIMNVLVSGLMDLGQVLRLIHDNGELHGDTIHRKREMGGSSNFRLALLNNGEKIQGGVAVLRGWWRMNVVDMASWPEHFQKMEKGKDLVRTISGVVGDVLKFGFEKEDEAALGSELVSAILSGYFNLGNISSDVLVKWPGYKSYSGPDRSFRYDEDRTKQFLKGEFTQESSTLSGPYSVLIADLVASRI